MSQESLDLKGRAPDSLIEEVKAHPDRTIDFRFVEHPAFLRGEALDESGQPTGIFFTLCKNQLAASRRLSQ